MARSRSQTAAILFVDIAAAYYGVVREAILGCGGSSCPLEQLVASLGLTHDDLQRLQVYIEQEPVLAQQDAPALFCEVAEELHRNTWFILSGDAQVVETHRGTRPGGSLADIIFSILFSRVLGRRCQSTLQPFVPKVCWNGVRTPWPDATPDGCTARSVEASDVVYADDLASFLVCARAEEVSHMVANVAADTIDTLLPHGLNANIGPTKTAALEGKQRLFACKRVPLLRRASIFRAHTERLRFLGQLVRHGPDVAWGLLSHYEGFKAGLRDAADWLLAATGAADGLPDIQRGWDVWMRLLSDSPGRWKAMLKRAEAWYSLRDSQTALLDGFVREALAAAGALVVDSSVGHVQAPAVPGIGSTEDVDDELFQAVKQHIAPLPVLRFTLEQWISGLPVGSLRSAAEDVLLILRPEHVCDRVAGPSAGNEDVPLSYLPIVDVPRAVPRAPSLPILHNCRVPQAWRAIHSLQSAPLRLISFGSLVQQAGGACSGICLEFPAPPETLLPVFRPPSCSVRSLRGLCDWISAVLDALRFLVAQARSGCPVFVRFPVDRDDLQPLSGWLMDMQGPESEETAFPVSFTSEFNRFCLH
ncbi:unnamed protein product [Symbiodinium sp. CCMP2456]|nr:unnamed protein product [Symbiodinium sp. CCMP2456]